MFLFAPTFSHSSPALALQYSSKHLGKQTGQLCVLAILNTDDPFAKTLILLSIAAQSLHQLLDPAPRTSLPGPLHFCHVQQIASSERPQAAGLQTLDRYMGDVMALRGTHEPSLATLQTFAPLVTLMAGVIISGILL